MTGFGPPNRRQSNRVGDRQCSASHTAATAAGEWGDGWPLSALSIADTISPPPFVWRFADRWEGRMNLLTDVGGAIAPCFLQQLLEKRWADGVFLLARRVTAICATPASLVLGRNMEGADVYKSILLTIPSSNTKSVHHHHFLRG